MKRMLLLALALVLATPAVLADPVIRMGSPAGSEELQLRMELREQSGDLLREKNFAELDRLAVRYRKGERTPSGIWKLDLFYFGLIPEKGQRDERYWEMCLDRFREWIEQRPDSITAPICLANVWTSYAWDARGSGWARDVTETGWKLFRQRLEKANQILVKNSQEYAACPYWHSMMIRMVRERSWPRVAAWEFLKASAAAFPDYFGSYMQMMANLQPRWGGRPGEMVEMADWAAKNAGGDLGKEIYARICWTIWEWEKAETFLSPATGVDWEKMKAGLEVMMEKYPDSKYNRAAFCHFAWLFQDRPVVRELLPELDRRLLMQFWPDWKSMNEARAWIK